MSSSDASALVDSSDDDGKQSPVNGHETPLKRQAVLTKSGTKRGRATRTATSSLFAQAGTRPTAAAAAANDDSCGARKKSRLEHGTGNRSKSAGRATASPLRTVDSSGRRKHRWDGGESSSSGDGGDGNDSSNGGKSSKPGDDQYDSDSVIGRGARKAIPRKGHARGAGIGRRNAVSSHGEPSPTAEGNSRIDTGDRIDGHVDISRNGRNPLRSDAAGVADSGSRAGDGGGGDYSGDAEDTRSNGRKGSRESGGNDGKNNDADTIATRTSRGGERNGGSRLEEAIRTTSIGDDINDPGYDSPYLGEDASESSEGDEVEEVVEAEFQLDSDEHTASQLRQKGRRLSGGSKGKRPTAKPDNDRAGRNRRESAPTARTKGKGRAKKQARIEEDWPARRSPAADKALTGTTRSTVGAGAAVSSGDEEGCLTDSGSEGGESHAERLDAAEPVRCRCGAEDWKDGYEWIRCDGRGCWTWEHVACAYPSLDKNTVTPKVHLCPRCKRKGPIVSVRTLARGAGDTTPERRKQPPTPPQLPSAGGRLVGSGSRRGGRGEEEAVRRSRRVANIEGIRPLLQRKNIVKEVPSSSEDDFGDEGGDVFRQIGKIAAPADHGDSGSDSDSQFLAPEGKVEISQEFRCRCGTTREDEGVRGQKACRIAARDDDGDRSVAKNAGEEDIHGSLWVQCGSDSCGIWEHAACCDYGCAERGREASRHPSRKHWCRACDPKGKRHRKHEDRWRRLRTTSASGAGRGAAASFKANLGGSASKQGRGLDAQTEMLLDDLWGAVAAGDIALLGTSFREAEKKGGQDCVRRLLNAKSPPLTELGLNLSSGVDSERVSKVTGRRKSKADSLPTGLTLLMFAAGYWTKVVADKLAGTAGKADGGVRNTDNMAATAAAAKGTDIAGVVRSSYPDETASTREPLSLEATFGEGRALQDGADNLTGAEDKEEEVQQVVPGNVSESCDGQDMTSSLVNVPATAGLTEKSRAAVTDQQTRHLGSEARLEVLRAVLDRSGDPEAVLAADCEGRTAVHHAAGVNGAAEVAMLLRRQAKAEAAFKRDQRGFTPIHVAVTAGHSEAYAAILNALPLRLRARALTDTEKSSGDNVLHLACAYGHANCVEAILREEDELQKKLSLESIIGPAAEEVSSPSTTLLLARNSDGATPLMTAAACPSSECLQLALKSFMSRSFDTLAEKLDELRAVDDRGMNALHWASEGSVSAAKCLIAAERKLVGRRFPSLQRYTGSAGWDMRAMINCGDSENGASPLHLAAAVSHKKMVSFLLEAGANAVMLDGRGWTPVMYADFDGRKEGAILELLQHEPEKQLEALGNILNSPYGRNQPRVIEVMQNLATVPAFFSLVNGFVRKNPGLLLTTLSFLRESPGLLDFENKRNLLRTLLSTPDYVTRVALDAAAGAPYGGFGFNCTERIDLQRGDGEALYGLLRWMEASARRWGKSGLAAWLRIKQPSFHFQGEAGCGPGVDREAWELIAEDLVRPPSPPPPPSSPRPVTQAQPATTTPSQTPAVAATTSSRSPTSAATQPPTAAIRETNAIDLTGGRAGSSGGDEAADLASASHVDHGASRGLSLRFGLDTPSGKMAGSPQAGGPTRQIGTGSDDSEQRQQQQHQQQGLGSNGSSGGGGNGRGGGDQSPISRGTADVVAGVDLSGQNGDDDVDFADVVVSGRAARTRGTAPTAPAVEVARGNMSSRHASYFVPVDSGMSSYCPRDLMSDHVGSAAVTSAAGRGGREEDREGTGQVDDDLRAFEMVGIVIGANLGWNKVLNLNLNPVVWKAILSREAFVSDLQLVDETYYRSLKQVLDMKDVDQLGLSFRALDLKFCMGMGGVNPDDEVTDDNKDLYATLALESRTFGRWRTQCHALSEGLRRLVPLRLLKMFTENELGLLLAGPGEIDPDDWQRHAVFSGSASVAIRTWFWSLVRSLTKEEKSLLLQFATGCSRLPAGGFAALPRPFTVAMMDYDAHRPLPMAATCFFMLKLPRYPDMYSLRKNLLVAIRHGSSGFAFS